MTDRIDAGIPFQPTPSGAEGAQPSAGSAGSYRGQQVTHNADVMSLIADAAEELSFAASEKVEKKLSKRKIGKKAGMKRAVPLFFFRSMDVRRGICAFCDESCI